MQRFKLYPVLYFSRGSNPMTIASIYENEKRGTWDVYRGMDQIETDLLDRFDSYEAAWDAVTDLDRDALLVLEADETGAYTAKYEFSWPSYELVDGTEVSR